jgi:hypothetical protein
MTVGVKMSLRWEQAVYFKNSQSLNEKSIRISEGCVLTSDLLNILINFLDKSLSGLFVKNLDNPKLDYVDKLQNPDSMNGQPL